MAPRPIRLLGDLILVEADSRETMESGLIAPSEAQHMDEALRHRQLRRGTVRGIGLGRKSRKGVRLPVDVAPGDRVTFTDWVGAPRPDLAPAASDSEFLVMHDSEILAVL